MVLTQARNLRWIGLTAILMLLFAPTIVFAALATVDQLIRLFPDDAFYYLQTAYNTAHFGLVSFDRISVTNGFHPLQFVVSMTFATISGKETLLRWVVVENAVLVLFVSLILSRHFFYDRIFFIQLAAVIVLASPIWYLYLWLDAGMEMGLVLLLGTSFYCAWERASNDSFASLEDNCRLAALAALLILARLDISLALLPFAAIYFFTAIKKRIPAIFVAAAALIVILLLSPYLIWNWVQFGHLVPISGIVKAQAVHDLRSNWRALSAGTLIGTALVLLPLTAAFAALFSARTQRCYSPLLLLSISVGLFYGYCLFYATQVFRWYLAYPLVLQCVSMAILLREGLSRRPLSLFLSARTIALLGLISAGLHLAIYAWAARIETTSLYLKHVADDINSRINENEIIATYDAGVIGYFSKTRVVNLDGLANSYIYYERYLKPNRIGDYLRNIGATYYLARINNGNQPSLAYGDNIERVVDYRNSRQFDLTLYRIAR